MIIHVGYAINTAKKTLIISCYHQIATNAKVALRVYQKKLSLSSPMVEPTFFSINTEDNDFILSRKKSAESLSVAIVTNILFRLEPSLTSQVFSNVIFCGDVNLAKESTDSIAEIFLSQKIENHFSGSRVFFMLQSGDIEVVNGAHKKLGADKPYNYMKPVVANIWISPKGEWPSNFTIDSPVSSASEASANSSEYMIKSPSSSERSFSDDGSSSMIESPIRSSTIKSSANLLLFSALSNASKTPGSEPVDNSSSHRRRPSACPQDPEILSDKTADSSTLTSPGSHGQANRSCQQALTFKELYQQNIGKVIDEAVSHKP
jgi:hypothetical protein